MLYSVGRTLYLLWALIIKKDRCHYLKENKMSGHFFLFPVFDDLRSKPFLQVDLYVLITMIGAGSRVNDLDLIERRKTGLNLFLVEFIYICLHTKIISKNMVFKKSKKKRYNCHGGGGSNDIMFL